MERYLREGGKEVPLERKTAVDELIRIQYARVGSLLIENPEAAAEVSVDGQQLAATSLAGSMFLEIGRHVVIARRSDHALFAQPVEIRAGQVTTLQLEFPARESAATPPRAALPPPRLSVQTWPADARVRVDGLSYSGGVIETGTHRIEVVRPGFMSFHDVMRFEAGTPQRLTVALSRAPSPPWNRTPWIVAGGVSAVALGALAASLYVWNGSRYADWQRDRHSLDALASQGPEDANLHRQRSALYDRQAAIQTVDALALSSALLGASALITSGILWLTQSPTARQ